MTAPSVRDDLAGVDWERLERDLVADRFSNGRTPAELRRSFESSHATALVVERGRVVGTARVLADGVCNAWLADVWTLSSRRGRGIATAMVRRLLERVPGHHVALFTEDAAGFYRRLGFREERTGMSMVSGRWLNRPA